MLYRVRKISERSFRGVYLGVGYIFLEVVFYAASVLLFFHVAKGLLNKTMDAESVFWVGTAAVLLAVLRMLLACVSYKTVMIEAYKITSGIRVRLATHLKEIALGFFMKKNIGNLSNAILQDTNLLDFLLSHIFIRWIRDVFAVSLLLGIMAYLNIQLFSLSICILLVSIPFFVLARSTTINLGSKRLVTIDKTDSYILEYIQGIAIMKSFGLVGEQNTKMLNQLKQLAKDSLIAEASILSLGMLFTLTIELGLPVLFYIVMQDYLKVGQVDFNSILFILTYMLMYLAMFDVMQYSLLGQHMLNAASRVEELLAQPVLSKPEQPMIPSSHAISFSDVSFAYGKKKVLNNVSFTAKEHAMTALVGHSGAGKSTITNLLPLFWNSYSGSITIGGVNVRDIPNKDLMDIFSFVFQEVYLFNDTIYNNILCGKKDASREEVLEAAGKARCQEFIDKLEDGYETVVSEGGATLSGGQRQRISIARAILKNAPVVILDEATTALDPINELHIQEAISELIKDKTVITIAHRLYTIVHADNIVVLEDGKVLDSGSHSYLLDNCSAYSTMFDSTL